MKNKKITLNDLKVKSFVTHFEEDNGATVKGGSYDCASDIGVLCSRRICSDFNCPSDHCSQNTCNACTGTTTGGVTEATCPPPPTVPVRICYGPTFICPETITCPA